MASKRAPKPAAPAEPVAAEDTPEPELDPAEVARLARGERDTRRAELRERRVAITNELDAINSEIDALNALD